jgi:hypothetical protein
LKNPNKSSQHKNDPQEAREAPAPLKSRKTAAIGGTDSQLENYYIQGSTLTTGINGTSVAANTKNKTMLYGEQELQPAAGEKLEGKRKEMQIKQRAIEDIRSKLM